MSVLIKGMEMPPSCFLCKLSFMSGERLFCSAMKNEEVLRSKIDSNCPLIEVPPHGDLIDRNTLMQHEVLLPMDGGYMPIVYASYVRNAPTIIPGEESE